VIPGLFHSPARRGFAGEAGATRGVEDSAPATQPQQGQESCSFPRRPWERVKHERAPETSVVVGRLDPRVAIECRPGLEPATIATTGLYGTTRGIVPGRQSATSTRFFRSFLKFRRIRYHPMVVSVMLKVEVAAGVRAFGSSAASQRSHDGRVTTLPAPWILEHPG
jgi:hypothetical protein